jgi:hypothetical protein
MANYLIKKTVPQGLSLPGTDEDRRSTASSESLFQSARRGPGGEMLGVGVALFFFLLVGGSLLGAYRTSDHQRPVPVREATVIAPLQRSELGRSIRGEASPPPARLPRRPVRVSPEPQPVRSGPGARPRPRPSRIERHPLLRYAGHSARDGGSPAGAPTCCWFGHNLSMQIPEAMARTGVRSYLVGSQGLLKPT